MINDQDKIFELTKIIVEKTIDQDCVNFADHAQDVANAVANILKASQSIDIPVKDPRDIASPDDGLIESPDDPTMQEIHLLTEPYMVLHKFNDLPAFQRNEIRILFWNHYWSDVCRIHGWKVEQSTLDRVKKVWDRDREIDEICKKRRFDDLNKEQQNREKVFSEMAQRVKDLVGSLDISLSPLFKEITAIKNIDARNTEEEIESQVAVLEEVIKAEYEIKLCDTIVERAKELTDSANDYYNKRLKELEKSYKKKEKELLKGIKAQEIEALSRPQIEVPTVSWLMQNKKLIKKFDKNGWPYEHRWVVEENILCLECNEPCVMLKTHLKRHKMSVKDYLHKWELPSDYPISSPSYKNRCRENAITRGLGKNIGSGRGAK